MKCKLKATTQPLIQQEDGVSEKPQNLLHSDILERKKSNACLKRNTNESNKLANKPTLNINNNRKLTSISTSPTNQNQEKSLKQQIKQLQQEVLHLKQNFNINEINNNPSLKEQ